MKKNKLAFKLIDMGLKAETLANLTESQLRLLYNKLNESKKESKEAATYTEYSNDELNQGVDIDGGGKVTKTPTGVKVQHSEMKEAQKKKSKKYNPGLFVHHLLVVKTRKNMKDVLWMLRNQSKKVKTQSICFWKKKLYLC